MPEPLTRIDGFSEDLKETRGCPSHKSPGNAQGQISKHITIDTLPDEVLVNVSDHYRGLGGNLLTGRKKALVDVCRRWRCIIFASPLRLNLQIVCDSSTPVGTRMSLDTWPPFPIVVGHMFPRRGGEEIIVAALERRDRVAKVSLYETTSSAFQRFTAVMQEPLSALKELRLSPRFYLFRPELVLPETFLKGSAPSLQSLNLNGIAFPALSKFISFCQAHLTLLRLINIPDTWDISPEEMVIYLSASAHLEVACIRFKHSRSWNSTVQTSPSPSPTRTVLPALSKFCFDTPNHPLDIPPNYHLNVPQLD